jgi:hypothetical protein
MEAISSSETLSSLQATQRYSAESSALHDYHHDNLKAYSFICTLRSFHSYLLELLFCDVKSVH